jgi:hypothetical protein
MKLLIQINSIETFERPALQSFVETKQANSQGVFGF